MLGESASEKTLWFANWGRYRDMGSSSWNAPSSQRIIAAVAVMARLIE
jgi:hypothetical protein